MAKYKITAPDGRVVTISGDHVPGEADLNAIFASLPPVETPEPTPVAQEPQVEKSNVEKANDAVAQFQKDVRPAVHSGVENTRRISQVGADTFPVLGNAYVPVMAGSDATMDYLADKLGFGAYVPQKPDGTPATWRERYDRAAKQYKSEIAETEAQHPWLSLGAGLATGAYLPLGAASSAAKGGRLAAALGTAMPLAAVDAGLRTDGDLSKRVENSLAAAATAGVVTPVFMGAPALAGKVGSRAMGIGERLLEAARTRAALVNPTAQNVLTRRQVKMLADDVGGRDILESLIGKARERGVSLAEVGDANITRALEKANIASPAARRTISGAVEARAAQSPAETAAVFDETLGLKKGLQSLDVLETDYAKQAQPLYNKAFKHTVDGKTLMELQKNTLINDAMTDVNKHYGSYFGGRAKVEPNSVEYLDGVKRSLDNRIAGEINSPAPDMKKVAFLESARDEILKAADNVAPTYRYARNTSSNKFEIGDAYKLGKNVFDGHMTTEEFIGKVAELNKTPAARDALKMGVRATLTDKLGAKTSDATTFSKLITPNAQAKIKALVGEKEGQRLIDYARKQYNWNQAMNKATQGSPTAPRLQLAEEALGPVGTLVRRGDVVAAGGQVVGKALQSGAKALGRVSDDKNYNAIANALLNPASELGVAPSRADPVREVATDVIIRALGGVARGADAAVPVLQRLQRLPVRTIGVTNQELLKALQNK